MNVVKKHEREEFLYIDSKEYSIEKKWGELEELINVNGFLDFTEYLLSLDNLQEILVSFFYHSRNDETTHRHGGSEKTVRHHLAVENGKRNRRTGSVK